jgi:hypothetical protein
MSHEELITLLSRRDARIAIQDGQIGTLSRQVSELVEANEALAAKLARVEHLLSRNSQNSSMPPSKDDDPGRAQPMEKSKRRGGGSARKRASSPARRGRTWPSRTTPTNASTGFHGVLRMRP